MEACLSRRALMFLLIATLGMAGSGDGAAPKRGGNGGQGAGPAKWEETIKKFEAADAEKAPAKGGVLLVGGSNARRWVDVATYFPEQQVLNRGFGGARLEDVLHYADRIVLPYAPRVILLNAGGNDLSSGKSPEQIRETARAFITKVHAALPETRILVISLPPVRRAAETPGGLDGLRAMNKLLGSLATPDKKVEFVDLFPVFLDEKGQHRAELFVEDGTHFSPRGYETLAGLLRARL